MSNHKQLFIEIPTWAHVNGKPDSTGKIKIFPNDFIVDEQLSFQADGAGEHAFLQIEKCGENTEYVARLLARFAGVRQRDVSYAGLKDRHARTTQWFSVWLPGKQDPEWKQLETEEIKIIQATRHARKLKRGVLSGNKFQILIRQWQGDKEKIEQQLQQIKQQGIPNYFGVQRFGHQGQNVNKALALFDGAKVKREQRSIYLSAARSYLFNQLLASRVNAANWNKAISGDCFIFDQSNSYFKTERLDNSVVQRAQAGEIHPAGMMFGKGKSEVTDQALVFENAVVTENQALVDGLIKYDLTADRRALRVFVNDLSWIFKEDAELLLSFSLPSGSYATSVLRELVNVD
ncbi:MAG: tRNA pseudouridine(13) synthase TruD [Methylococcales bacterium]|nr:tRNA pseudouridine(13) synthase TruD [Methylococcales bacterium]